MLSSSLSLSLSLLWVRSTVSAAEDDALLGEWRGRAALGAGNDGRRHGRRRRSRASGGRSNANRMGTYLVTTMVAAGSWFFLLLLRLCRF